MDFISLSVSLGAHCLETTFRAMANVTPSGGFLSEEEPEWILKRQYLSDHNSLNSPRFSCE